MNPQFPLYIVSKGRHETRLTSKALEKADIPYSIVVEKQDFDKYASVIDESKIIILDEAYIRDYDRCLENQEISPGPGAARNFVWDHSISAGHEYHWVMDDNIRGFYRLSKNMKIPCRSGVLFEAMEDFCLRYSNVAMAGPNYEMFVPRKQRVPPFIYNTRIYSCNLIRNNVPFRWRGRYNEDTILSLDMLKAGYCTIQFNAFLQKKVTTQLMEGGNTAEFYADEGTYPKSKMLVDLHPDVARLAWRFGRCHHHVNYKPFRANKLRRKQDIAIPKGVNNYGMKLKQIGKAHHTTAEQQGNGVIIPANKT